MADPNAPRVKQEAGTTTIGGVVRTTFAPKIPVRRRPGEGGAAAAAGGAASGGAAAGSTGTLADLISVKEERKFVPRPRLASTHTPSAARVAFQPSQPGAVGAASSTSGDTSDTRDVAVVVMHAPGNRLPGQEDPAAKDKKPRVKGEAGAADEAGASAAAADASGVAVEDVSAEDAADEAELAGMLATENAYDSFLDNGDLVQYRPILLPFPKVRVGLGNTGRASTVQRGSVVPSPSASARPASSQSGVLGMFDIDDEAAAGASTAAAVAAASAHAHARSPSPNSMSSTPYKLFPAHSPARLLSHIDHEEKSSDGGISQHLLFFQFPSHLPFKQDATWAPPVNPLLSLNGDKQPGHGATGFGAGPSQASGAAGAAGARGGAAGAGASGPSDSLQALQNISSPMLPPMAGLSGGGVPSFSLGSSAGAGAGAASGAAGKKGAGAAGGAGGGGAGGGGSSSSGAAGGAAVDSLSSLGGPEDEQDLGDVSKGIDPSKVSDAERLAREHKARQARKLLLYSSNFEHAMRHLPAGQLGSLVVYKSGKIKMRIGDILLDVNEGVQCLFHQELMSVQAATGEAFRLGPVNHRLVCTNDVEDLVRKTRDRAVPTPNAR